MCFWGLGLGLGEFYESVLVLQEEGRREEGEGERGLEKMWNKQIEC